MGTTRREASYILNQYLESVVTIGCPSYHARAGERVPTETDTISVLDIAPLVLERLEVGHSGRSQLSALLEKVWGWVEVVEGWWWRDRGHPRWEIDLAGRCEMWQLRAWSCSRIQQNVPKRFNCSSLKATTARYCNVLRAHTLEHAWIPQLAMRPDVLALAPPIGISFTEAPLRPRLKTSIFLAPTLLLFTTASNTNTT